VKFAVTDAIDGRAVVASWATAFANAKPNPMKDKAAMGRKRRMAKFV
jgi:hypothetical protein